MSTETGTVHTDISKLSLDELTRFIVNCEEAKRRQQDMLTLNLRISESELTERLDAINADNDSRLGMVADYESRAISELDEKIAREFESLDRRTTQQRRDLKLRLADERKASQLEYERKLREAEESAHRRYEDESAKIQPRIDDINERIAAATQAFKLKKSREGRFDGLMTPRGPQLVRRDEVLGQGACAPVPNGTNDAILADEDWNDRGPVARPAASGRSERPSERVRADASARPRPASVPARSPRDHTMVEGSLRHPARSLGRSRTVATIVIVAFIAIAVIGVIRWNRAGQPEASAQAASASADNQCERGELADWVVAAVADSCREVAKAADGLDATAFPDVTLYAAVPESDAATLYVQYPWASYYLLAVLSVKATDPSLDPSHLDGYDAARPDAEVLAKAAYEVNQLFAQSGRTADDQQPDANQGADVAATNSAKQFLVTWYGDSYPAVEAQFGLTAKLAAAWDLTGTKVLP